MGRTSAKPPPDSKPALSAELRAMLTEWQRADLARVNATRRLLGLPPVRAHDNVDKPKTVV